MLKTFERVSGQVEQWLSLHALAASPLDLKGQKAEIKELVPANMGSWGTLRVLVRLEAAGDHQFDQLYQQTSARYDHWAALHPSQVRRMGLTLLPVPAAPAGAGSGSIDNPAASTGKSFERSPARTARSSPMAAFRPGFRSARSISSRTATADPRLTRLSRRQTTALSRGIVPHRAQAARAGLAVRQRQAEGPPHPAA